MENDRNKLPRDKFDFERIDEVKLMGKHEVAPLIPGLLEWIQDMNWPIAPQVVEILLDHPDEIVPHIRAVLATEDDIWKYWCLEYVVRRLPNHYQQMLIEDLKRMETDPTEGEKLEEVDKLASEILCSI